MGLYLGITVLIFVIIFIILLKDDFDNIGNCLWLFIFFEIVFSIIFFLISAGVSNSVYDVKTHYLNIIPQEGIYFKNLDGVHYLVNVGEKDTLVHTTEINKDLEVPRIKVLTQYRKTSEWYFQLQNKEQVYWILEIPGKFYEVPREFKVEKE